MMFSRTTGFHYAARYMKKLYLLAALLWMGIGHFGSFHALAATIDAINVQQKAGAVYLYLHTDAPVRHETVESRRNRVIVELSDVSVYGGAHLPIQYEKAPGVKSVMLEHVGPKSLRLTIEGKRLGAPIVGFRESQVVPVHPAETVASVPGAEGQSLLAVEPETTVNHAIAPTAVATNETSSSGDVVSHMMQQAEREGDRPAQWFATGILWAKNNRLVLLCTLTGGLALLFVANMAYRLMHARLSQPSDIRPDTLGIPSAQNVFNTLPAPTLPMARRVPTGFSTPPLPQTMPATPAVPSVVDGRLTRVREKMKAQGVGMSEPAAPTAPPIQPDGTHTRVKEAIARKKSQQYQRTMPPQAPASASTFTAPSAAAAPSGAGLAGNGFLHAMAEYMDTPSREHIAKAMQQAKFK
jgi:hypothetical protein